MPFPANIDHGRCGSIRVTSEWNSDREPPSRQVWVQGERDKSLCSSSALALDLGRIENTNGRGMLILTPAELAFVDDLSDRYEGAAQ